MVKNNILLIGVTGGRVLLRLFSTIIITRILTPEAFALVGLASSIVFVFELVSDAGARSFILKHKHGNSDKLLNCVWSFRILRSSVLFFLIIFLANPLAGLFEMPELALALYITSPIFILHGIKSLAPFVEDRKNKPAKPIFSDFIANVLAVVLIIITTIVLKSKWCIVIGLLYQPLFNTVFSYILFRQKKYKITYDRQIFIEILNWAKYVIPSSIITVILFQGDKFLFAKLISAEMLGFYYLAFRLSNMPAGYIISFSRRLVAPALSAAIHSSDTNLITTYYKSKNVILIMYSVGLGIATGSANLIVNIIYDDRYSIVGEFLSILLVRSFLYALTYPVEAILVAKGKIRTTLIANITRLLWIAILLYPSYIYYGEWGVLVTFVTMEVPPIIYLAAVSYKDGLYKLSGEVAYLAIFIIAIFIGKSAELLLVNYLY